MRLFLARVLPPLAVLFCGKPFSAFFNCFLTLFGWYPGVAHALDVVNNHLADKRNIRSISAINKPQWSSRVFPEQKVSKQLVSPPVINDPRIGAGGTRFRTKS